MTPLPPTGAQLLAETAALGRDDGAAQIDSIDDHMRHRHQFPSAAHWSAYVTGFYRGAGYAGSFNRATRRAIAGRALAAKGTL